jgi:hypothetical protein
MKVMDHMVIDRFNTKIKLKKADKTKNADVQLLLPEGVGHDSEGHM